MSSDDGAGRKVRRLNEIANKIRDHGNNGIPLVALQTWTERRLGLSPERLLAYVGILERTREVHFDPEKRRYYHVDTMR